MIPQMLQNIGQMPGQMLQKDPALGMIQGAMGNMMPPMPGGGPMQGGQAGQSQDPMAQIMAMMSGPGGGRK